MDDWGADPVQRRESARPGRGAFEDRYGVGSTVVIGIARQGRRSW